MQFSFVNYSELERTKRIDAEFFWPAFLDLNGVLLTQTTQPLTALCHVSDGNHLSVANHFQSAGGIPYFRGKDINTDFFIENANPIFIPESIYELPNMKRSWFEEGDILLSIVGTIGSLSLVTDKINRATGSCKLAILRAKKNSDSEYIASFLRSKYGQFQIQRNIRGAVQQGLILEDIDQIQVYEPGEEFKKLTSSNVKISIKLNRQSRKTYQQAQTILLTELGLADWRPKHQLTFSKNYSEVRRAERIDADYYQPKYDEIIKAIKCYFGGWDTLGNLCELVGHPSNPPYADTEDTDKTFIVTQKHLGDFSLNEEFWNDAEALYTTQNFTEKNSQYVLKIEDVLLYSVGAYIGKANIYKESIKATIGSFLTLLRAKKEKLNPYFLMAFLNTDVGVAISKQHQRGMAQQYLYPYDIRTFPIPLLPEEIQTEIQQKVTESFNLRKQSKHLLESAMHAVEIAIEENEQTATEWLGRETGEMQ